MTLFTYLFFDFVAKFVWNVDKVDLPMKYGWVRQFAVFVDYIFDVRWKMISVDNTLGSSVYTSRYSLTI